MSDSESESQNVEETVESADCIDNKETDTEETEEEDEEEEEVEVDYTSVLNPDGSLPIPFTEPEAFEADILHKMDSGWHKGKTGQLIDEFLDVNPEEKLIMKLWNHHWIHNKYNGDSDVPPACKAFVDINGHILFERNLYKNFVVFLTSLHCYGLLNYQEIREITLHYQSVKEQKDENEDLNLNGSSICSSGSSSGW